MGKKEHPNVSWFAGDKPKVDGFESSDCPHGFLRFKMENSRTDSTYACTECGKEMVVQVNLEEE